jgi:hypothetical protein
MRSRDSKDVSAVIVTFNELKIRSKKEILFHAEYENANQSKFEIEKTHKKSCEIS